MEEEIETFNKLI